MYYSLSAVATAKPYIKQSVYCFMVFGLGTDLHSDQRSIQKLQCISNILLLEH